MKDEFVTAYRGNQTKQFTRKSWEVMGTDKYGWNLIPEVPKEVASAISVEAERISKDFSISKEAGEFVARLNDSLEVDSHFEDMPAIKNARKPKKRR